MRAEHARDYDRAIGGSGVRRPSVHPRAKPAWHQYTLQLDPSRRELIAERLREQGVSVGIYYPIPLHRQPVYAHQNDTTSCPVAESAAQSVLSIPVHPGLDEEQVAYVARNVRDALFEV